MATTYAQAYTDHLDEGFQQRVRVALFVQANAVATASPASTTAELAMIGQILTGITQYVDLFALACSAGWTAAGGTITVQNCTDAQIQATVAAAWTAFAGNL